MNEQLYESLCQAVYKEKKSNELQLITKTFYSDIETYINDLKDGTEPAPAETKQNASKLLEELFEKRKQKILIYIAHNKSLPQSVPAIEQKFFELVSEDYRKITLDGYKSVAQQGITNLYVNKDIPEILLPSGRKIGPYKTGDIIGMENAEDINFLKSTAICKDKTE